MVCARVMHKKTPAKAVIEETIIIIIIIIIGDPELRKSFNWANLRRRNLSRSEQLQVYYLLQT